MAVLFALLWARSFWYDIFLGYEARVTQSHINHTFWTATDAGAFDIAVRWETLSPNYKRERGVWNFYDRRREPPFCIAIGGSQPQEFSFLGFRHWIHESPNSHRYNYTWIPFWFPVVVFALPPLWGFLRAKRKAPNPPPPANPAVAPAMDSWPQGRGVAEADVSG